MRQVFAQARDPRLFHTDFNACNAYVGGLAAAERVRCPAHLVLGALDKMTPPRAAQAIGKALKASVHTLPAGHFLMLESPDGCMAALRSALACA